METIWKKVYIIIFISIKCIDTYQNFTVIIHRLSTSKFAHLIKSVNNPQIDTRDAVTHIEKEKRQLAQAPHRAPS